MKKLTTLILGISLSVSALSASQITYEQKVINNIKAKIISALNCDQEVKFAISKLTKTKRQVLGTCETTKVLHWKDFDIGTKEWAKAAMEHDLRNVIALKKEELVLKSK